jgi:hypothetical protein
MARSVRECPKSRSRHPAPTAQSETMSSIPRHWQAPTLPVRLCGPPPARIEDNGCDRQMIGTPSVTCEGTHHRGILEHMLQEVMPCVSKARSL